MEDQSVNHFNSMVPINALYIQCRFTCYDFKKMQRRSYYPHNQHLVSTVTATSSGIASSRPGTPANDLRGPDGGIAVSGNSVDFNGVESENYRAEQPIPEKNYS